MLERLDEHPLDFLIGEAVGRLHLDRLLDFRAQLARRDAEDAVRVDLEPHLDARQPGDHRRNSLQMKMRERTVIDHELALALHDMDVDAGLIVDARREHLASARRDRRVAHDDLRHHAAHRLDAERERRDVEQEHLAAAADENVGLHGGAEGDDLVWIELAVRLAPEQLLDDLAHERDAGRSADEHGFVDVLRLESGIGKGLTARVECSIDERTNQAFELRARDALTIARRHGARRLDTDFGLLDV